jgi:transcriptional regulator with XRE-family HTH domain
MQGKALNLTWFRGEGEKGDYMEEERDFEEVRVGERVKALREQKGLSLKELADLTGFSTALLSQMENHLVSPSLGTIIKLAKALGVRVKYGYSYEALGFEKKDRHMEPFIVTLEPATVKTSKTSVHDGEEFIFVLDGEMEVILGNHTDVLYPGDSIYYDSNIPHRVQCHQDKVTKILAVLYTSST